MTESCCWPNCEAQPRPDIPICERHFVNVGLRYTSERQIFQQVRALCTPDPDRPPPKARHDPQVYYVRLSPDIIKIGYTTNLPLRVAALRVDPDALLASEPGGRDVERRRHEEFAAERISRREDFKPSARLLAHIASLQGVDA